MKLLLYLKKTEQKILAKKWFKLKKVLINSKNILIKYILCAVYVKAPLILLFEIHSTALFKYLFNLIHSLQLIKISANEPIVESDVLDKEDT